MEDEHYRDSHSAGKPGGELVGMLDSPTGWPEQPDAVEYMQFLPLLNDIASTIHKSRNIDAVMESVRRLVEQHLKGTNTVVLTVFNRELGNLFIEKAWGLSDEQQQRGVYRPGEGIIGRVLESGKPLVIPSVLQEPKYLNRTGSADAFGDCAYICVPLMWHQEVLGTLSVDRPLNDMRYHQLDLNLLSVVAAMISHAVQIHRNHLEENMQLKEENRRLLDELWEKVQNTSIIGSSRPMKQCLMLMERIYNKQTPVLILGESGTGKELIAQALHYNSERRNKPFIRFNCAALPESLAESELFGHEKGAFTGATGVRKGKFEVADGGSIFLDEVGELSLGIQAKLLRVLQNGEFERIGSNQPIQVKVRVICATHRDLPEMIRSGTFREDLYYRINVFPITVPALRERGSDVLLLANHFIEKYSAVHENPVRRISTPALDLLMSYHWPGNVRELENTIERAVILSDDGVIHSYHLPPSLQSAQSTDTRVKGTLQNRLDTLERELIVEALKYSRGNMAGAARDLGLTERVVALRCKKYNIDYQLYRNGDRKEPDGE